MARDFLPSDVGRLTMRGWQFPHHLQALQAAVMRLMSDDEYNRLIIELPIRHGKSLYCSWAFATWYLLTRPSRSVILATYQARFSEEWSHKVQETIRLYGPRLTGVGLGEMRTRPHWTLSAPHAGRFRTTSPGAGVAGRGADLLLADDLVKDQKEVANPARRHSLSTWFHAEFLTRLEPGGKVLMVMSRRHPDDMTGRCLAMNAELPARDHWHRLTLPAVGADGRALWPERWPLRKLEDMKRSYELEGMSYLWSSLYQQDPRGDSSLVEWPERYWEGIGYDPDQLANVPVKRRLLSLDPSKGAKDRAGDYSAWADVTVDTAATMWTYPHVKLLPSEAVEDYTVDLLARARYDGFVCECNGFQEVVADNVAKKCKAKGIHCPLFKKKNVENKEVRIRLGLGPLLEQKRVRLCAASTSYRLALSQLREFPTAAHDDFPDSLNLCVDLITYLLTGRK